MRRGSHMTDEQKANASTSHKGYIPWNKGIPMTDEQKAKLSAANTGHKASPEACAKMSEMQKEIQNRPEVKAKQSIASIGNIRALGYHHTEEAKAKISTANVKRIVSPETRAKESANQMGKSHPQSPETRMKISEHSGMKGKLGVLSPYWKGGGGIRRIKRRTLGFNYLNPKFIGCDGHHLDKFHVLHIPRTLHRSVPHNIWIGYNMVQINTLAVQWWMTQIMKTGHILPIGE